MVKQNIIVKEKKSKPEKKCSQKLVVQYKRLSIPRVAKKKSGYLTDSTKKNHIDKKKSGKKNSKVNNEKYKFSILDYLRTSISDKLTPEETVKCVRKKKKGADCENKPLNDCNDFGNIYDLDDDFIDIPLDVVITTDVSIIDEEALSPNISDVKTETAEEDVRWSSAEPLVPDDSVTPMVPDVSDASMVPDDSNAHMVPDDSDAPIDLDDLASPMVPVNLDVSVAPGDSDESTSITVSETSICGPQNNLTEIEVTVSAPEIKSAAKVKDFKGTHFLLTDDSLSSKNCQICSATFSCAYKLKRHMLSHSDARSFFCSTCGNGFKTNYHLSRHLANVHAIVGVFACELCDKRFTSKLSLREHKLEEHPSTSFLCSVCSKTYASKKGMKRHMKQFHPAS